MPNLALVANPLGSHHRRDDLDHDTYIPQIAGALQAETYHHGGYPNQTMNSDNGHVLPSEAGVRRLTPLECERLQGFPDGWTRYGPLSDRGDRERDRPWEEQADSHRYRQMGNAVCVPVAEWIGRRLVAVDAA